MADYDTCAHALPGSALLRDDDGQTLHQVTSYCRSAKQCDGAYALQGTSLCQACPQYANRSKVIHIRNGSFTATILFDRLWDFPTKNLKTLFRRMLKAEWENAADIAQLTGYLETAIVSSKEAWHAASARYALEWRLIDKPIRRQTKEQIMRDAAIRARNDELTRDVKRAKRLYERWVSIQALWTEMKQKWNVGN